MGFYSCQNYKYLRKVSFRKSISQFGYMSTKPTDSSQYCSNMVRQFDRENFFCSLLLDGSVRSCAFAIRAFNIEIARVQDQTSDPKISDMRFKFWSDAVEMVCDPDESARIPNHPVAVELRKVIRNGKVSKRYLRRLIASRRERAGDGSFPTVDSLESYAEQSVSSVLYLILESSGIANVGADHAASHIGKAQGITNAIRSIPHLMNRRVLSIPRELLLKHDITEEEIIRGKISDEFQYVIFDLASRANYHVEKARSLKKDVPKEALNVLLPATAVGLYLNKLKNKGFNVFDHYLMSSSPFLPMLLWWNNKRSRY